MAWIIAIMAGGTVLLTTPLVMWLGQAMNWVDQPGRRKQHCQPKVRVGGIALCWGMLMAFIGVLRLTDISLLTHQTTLVAIILGSLLSFGIGLVDDIRGLSPGLRLGCQAGVTLLVWHLGLHIEALPIPGVGTIELGYLSLPITFLWLAGVTNAINWIDGLDGLAAGTVAIASALLAIVCYQFNHSLEATLALGLTATLVSFLCYNARPAQLFMGDGGSYLIGFLWASLATTLMQTASPAQLWTPYLMLAVPILDMVYVIGARICDRKSPFSADRRHFHHRLLDSGFSYSSTVWQMYLLTAATGSFAVAIAGHRWLLALPGLLGLMLIGLTVSLQRDFSPELRPEAEISPS